LLDGVVTAFEEDSRLALRATDAQGIEVEIDAAVASAGATTNLRWSIRVSLPLRFRSFESMIAPELRRAVVADLANLKRRLESVAG
jgi:hypothetical protein